MNRFKFYLKAAICTCAVALAFVSFSGFRAADDSQPCVEGHARGVALSDPNFSNCIQPYLGDSFWELSIDVIGTAGKDGCTYEVTATICPRCQPNEPCPRIACFQIATANIDSEYNVWNVTCMQ